MEQSTSTQDGRDDFDFFIGRWKVHHRRLRERLTGCTDWETFEGECSDYKALNGLANVDEGWMERESGRLHGMTVRLFNPQSREWSLYWADTASATLQVPMVGGFTDGRGEFFSQEVFEGRHIFCRFIWSGITAQTCRWEQAFSVDGGATWETNWVMDFERIA